MPEMKFESVILHVCLISVRLNPSHVHLKCAHTDPRSGPRSRQPNEVLAADVAGKQRGADLYERQREVFSVYLQASFISKCPLKEVFFTICSS